MTPEVLSVVFPDLQASQKCPGDPLPSYIDIIFLYNFLYSCIYLLAVPGFSCCMGFSPL